MFFLIWGFRRRVVDAGHGTYHCPVCKRVQSFALKQIARYFTLFFIPIVRAGAVAEYAVCLGCRNALKRAVLEAAAPAMPTAATLTPREPRTPQTPRAEARLAQPPREVETQRSPRPAVLAAPASEPAAVAPRPAFGQSAFAKATYARPRRPAPSLGAPTPSGPSFFTPRR